MDELPSPLTLTPPPVNEVLFSNILLKRLAVQVPASPETFTAPPASPVHYIQKQNFRQGYQHL